MHRILVVDDDKITHAFIKRSLVAEYDLVSTFNGQQALEELERSNPDIILLDVEMPGMNGYEVCENIKSNLLTADIPVIFLSARGELRDRMLGFEAGADDYIVKPFQPEDLKAKINVLIQYRMRHKEIAKQVDEARKTAFIAISSTSDLGQAINFIEKSHTVTNFDQLVAAFFCVTQSMDLKCTIMIKSPEKNVFYSSTHNSVSPIESELVEKLSVEKRFFDFGCRTQINYPNVALLIKNMPLDDMERYGRIKDFFPAMLSTADIKISQIRSQCAVIKQLDETQQAFDRITALLDTIKSSFESNQKQGIRIMRNMLMELDKQLPRMALEEDQEQYILDRVDKAIEEAHSAISSGQQINTSFSTVLENLKELLSKQQQLQASFLASEIDEGKDDDEGYEMDVELF
jgi:DNA-binding response OmpR family regulator